MIRKKEMCQSERSLLNEASTLYARADVSIPAMLVGNVYFNPAWY